MGNTSASRCARRWAALLMWAVVGLGVSSCTSGASDPPSTARPTTPAAAISTAQTRSRAPTAVVSISRSRSDDNCAGGSGEGVAVPLATYGDADSAELRLVGGVPPSARLCGVFQSLAGSRSGSAASTTSPLSYLFSLVQDGKVSSGGRYYWVGGAVGNDVRSVVISFSETPRTVTATLVPLSTDWQGFAFEYSPGPGYYAPSSRNAHGPQNAGLTFTRTKPRRQSRRFALHQPGQQHAARRQSAADQLKLSYMGSGRTISPSEVMPTIVAIAHCVRAQLSAPS